MTITLFYAVSDAQLKALAAADHQGFIRPGDGIRWATLEAMARHDRGWVTLHPAERTARITRPGVAMMRIGREERERQQRRAHRRSITRTIDPFRLITGGVCTRPSLHR